MFVLHLNGPLSACIKKCPYSYQQVLLGNNIGHFFFKNKSQYYNTVFSSLIRAVAGKMEEVARKKTYITVAALPLCKAACKKSEP